MKKKKGFTLVELLAVIVILAIIALIAIPLIGNVIEKAKIGALESSVNGLVESANMYYANNTIKGETINETTFDFEDGEQVSDKKLEYKGKVYNGKLILHTNGEVAVCIDDEDHYAYKNKNTDEIVSGNGTCLYDGTTGDFSSNSSINDLRGRTIAATDISKSEDGLNALIKIPEEGHYDKNSTISIPLDELDSNLIYKKVNIKSIKQYTGTPWYGSNISSIIDGNIDTSTYTGGIYGGNGSYLMFAVDINYARAINYVKTYAYNGGGAGVSGCNLIKIYGTNDENVLTQFNSNSNIVLMKEINLINNSVNVIALSNDLPLKNNTEEYRYYLFICYNNSEHQSIVELEMYE